MIELEATTRIDVDPAAVFEVLGEPSNHAAFTPAIERAQSTGRLPGGGHRLEYTYEMAGVTLTGEGEQVVFEPGERLEAELGGGLDARLWWDLEADGDGTLVTYGAAYELPSATLESVAAPLAKRHNRRELEAALENLQSLVEGDGAE